MINKAVSYYLLVFLVLIGIALSWLILYKVPVLLGETNHPTLFWIYLLLVDAPILVGIFLFI